MTQHETTVKTSNTSAAVSLLWMLASVMLLVVGGDRLWEGFNTKQSMAFITGPAYVIVGLCFAFISFRDLRRRSGRGDSNKKDSQ